MNTPSIDTASPTPKTASPGLRRGAHKPPDAEEARKLRYACKEVEGMFLGMLMKQGLKPMLEEETEGMKQFDQLYEYAIEQSAVDLARQGASGMSEMLYQQLCGGR